MRPDLQFQDVSFAYPGQEPLFTRLDLSFPTGWTGLVGPNGAGKSTLLSLAAGALDPDQGRVTLLDPVVVVPQTTPAPPEGLDDFFADHDAEVWRLREVFGVDEAQAARWESLSPGEQKRFYAAVALWRRPALLLVDEPTNHLDADARDRLMAGLRRFRGVGLIVSHDRELLDTLCDHILFVDPGVATLYPGGYETASEARRIDREGRRSAYDAIRHERDRIDRERRRRIQQVEAAKRKNSGRRIDPKDHDAKERLGRARVTGKDARAGQAKGRIDRRWERLNREADASVIKKERGTGSVAFVAEPTRRAFLLQTEATVIPIGDERLHLPPLTLAPDQRVGVEGGNGAGKSRTLAWIVDQVSLPPGKVLYLPQELNGVDRRALRDTTLRLPPDRQGEVYAVAARLGVDPKRVRTSVDLSPGESRKLWLALALTGAPSLILLDEPTNHLDLPAVERLEEGLEGFGGGLIVVSHDRGLLDRLCPTRWRLTRVDGQRRLLIEP